MDTFIDNLLGFAYTYGLPALCVGAVLVCAYVLITSKNPGTIRPYVKRFEEWAEARGQLANARLAAMPDEQKLVHLERIRLMTIVGGIVTPIVCWAISPVAGFIFGTRAIQHSRDAYNATTDEINRIESKR